MKSDETFEYSDDGLYPADDVYGATSDFWGDADEDDSPEAPEPGSEPGSDQRDQISRQSEP